MSHRIGILPLYIKLYDDVRPDMRNGFGVFVERIHNGFEARGISVSSAPICRTADEFGAAVHVFEEEGVDAIVTVHLAYSPSLESIDVFCATSLPLLLLDTTMDTGFGLNAKADRITYNHGIHGVMDFACMLRRRKRPFEIVAGPIDDPRLFDRAAALIRGFAAAREFQGGRILRVGPPFDGMGDFAVDESVLRETFGLEIETVGLDAVDIAVLAVSETEIDAEIEADRKAFDCELDPEIHRRSVRVGLGLRRLLEKGGYVGTSVNFQAFDRSDRPADTMPFLEISKAMARGIGYGGEGDVLTAALVGALARAFGAVTFCEIFCADWTGGTLFLSHMGEISPSVATDRPRLIAKPFIFPDMPDPAVLTCAVKPGPAVYVNLAPGPDDTFTLILAPVEVLAEDDTLDPAMQNTVRAWIRPRLPVADFLEQYARVGGTHHSALVLGDHVEALGAFGRRLGVDVVNIQ